VGSVADKSVLRRLLPGYSLEISSRTTCEVPGTVLKLSARKQTDCDLKTSEEDNPHVRGDHIFSPSTLQNYTET
jgi:hypothetical protein